MRKRIRIWLPVTSAAAIAIAAPLALTGGGRRRPRVHHSPLPDHHLTKPGAYPHGHGHAINCSYASAMCVEVADSDKVFGHYVGHDEPSMLFNSSIPGSGNHLSYNMVLPKDPRRAIPTAGTSRTLSSSVALSGWAWPSATRSLTRSR